jgi:nucleotide-binding universal stress UspA family protein
VQTILVPIDFSEVSKDVLVHAASLARAFGAELNLVHVAAPDPDFVGYEVGPQTVREDRAGQLRREHRDLQAAADDLREQGIETKALLIQGPTVETIVKEAKKLGADMIVLGSHGHGAMHRLLLGSVSEGVLRAAPCPLVIVPATQSASQR